MESLATLAFDYRELLDAPGKKFDDAITIDGTACYTHADVLEVLDRVCAWELYYTIGRGRVSVSTG